jgi:hypothetical protein
VHAKGIDMTRMAAVLLAVLLGSAGPAAAQSDSPSVGGRERVQPQETVKPLENLDPPQAVKPPEAAAPPADDARYTFHRMRDGFVRLDSATGQVANCGWGPAGWTCTVAPDERVALEAEIARVRTENSALKRELLARGIDLPSGVRPDRPAAPAPETKPEPKVPEEAELDRAFSFMKGVWRRLIEMMSELQRDIQKKS